MTPIILMVTDPPSAVGGVRAIRSMPLDDNRTKLSMRTLYGTLWIKYGATSFVRKEGMTSARRTTPLGMLGPTRSRAAERMMT